MCWRFCQVAGGNTEAILAKRLEIGEAFGVRQSFLALFFWAKTFLVCSSNPLC
jgi:hypothetical protein